MPIMNFTPPQTGDLFNAFPDSPADILCVDIGGSAIKIAVLSASSHVEFIEQLYGGNCPHLKRTEWKPKEDGASNVVELIQNSIPIGAKFSSVLISLPGEEVSANGRKTRNWLQQRHGMPADLASKIEEAFDLQQDSASLCHDTLAWGLGVRALLASEGKNAGSGIAVLAVGTGVAYSVVRTTSVATQHLHAQSRYDWQKLAELANFNPNDWIHDHLGTEYFQWRDNKFNAPQERQQETQTRFQLLLDELERRDLLSTFVFAGGLANELEKCSFNQNHICLTKSTLGFDPEFVPMLGMLSSASPNPKLLKDVI